MLSFLSLYFYELAARSQRAEQLCRLDTVVLEVEDERLDGAGPAPGGFKRAKHPPSTQARS